MCILDLSSVKPFVSDISPLSRTQIVKLTSFWATSKTWTRTLDSELAPWTRTLKNPDPEKPGP